MTSNDFKMTSKNVNENGKKVKTKINIYGGFIANENLEIDDQYLDEILDNNDIYMGLAIEIISNDQAETNDTVQDLKNFNDQSLETQAKEENN